MSYCSELGIAKTEGFADDYAFLIRGLLDLFEAGQDTQWLEWAWQLQQKMDELFWDKEGGGYYTATTSDPSILIRMKEGVVPVFKHVHCHKYISMLMQKAL